MDKYDEDQQVTMAQLQKELKKAVSDFTDAGGTKNDLEKYFDEHKHPEYGNDFYWKYRVIK